LLAEDDADGTVNRLVGLVAEGSYQRDFLPEFDAARALGNVLTAASAIAHSQVAAALLGWTTGKVVLQPLVGIPAVLDMQAVTDAVVVRLREWAQSSIISDDRDKGALAVELLLALTRRTDARDAAIKALIEGFGRAPSLRLALGLLVTDSVPAAAITSVGDFLSTYNKSPRPPDRLDPNVLLAILAERDERYVSEVQRLLANQALSLEEKALTLAQVALGKTSAASIISEDVAALIRQQAEELDSGDGRGGVQEWAWLRALARAGRVGAEEALTWTGEHAGGPRQERWQAAHALDALAAALGESRVETLYSVLIADDDVEVAAEAARRAPNLANVVHSHQLERGLRALLNRPGAHGPLVAARALRHMGLVRSEDRARWRIHPSAFVRLEAARPKPS